MKDTPRVVYDDGGLIAVNKPTGLLTVPGRDPSLSDCLWTRLREFFPEREILLVHRLDRDTSGVILFACTKEVQVGMGRRFERRQVYKEYLAIVHGVPEPEEGVVNTRIRKDWTRNNPPVYVTCEEGGREAVTRYRVEDTESKRSRVRLWPETGRSHQLRVHLTSLGCPVVGDPIYGPPEDTGQMCLCAEGLSFYHPLTRKRIEISIKAPF